MRKKLFAILMSAMMMVTFMPAMAFAATGDLHVTKVTWSDNYDSASVEYTADSADGGATGSYVVSGKQIQVSFDANTGVTTATIRDVPEAGLKFVWGAVAHEVKYYDITDAVITPALAADESATVNELSADDYCDLIDQTTTWDDPSFKTGKDLSDVLGGRIVLYKPASQRTASETLLTTAKKVIKYSDFVGSDKLFTVKSVLPKYEKYQDNGYFNVPVTFKATEGMNIEGTVYKAVNCDKANNAHKVYIYATNLSRVTVDMAGFAKDAAESAKKLTFGETNTFNVTYVGADQNFTVATKGVTAQYSTDGKTWTDKAPEMVKADSYEFYVKVTKNGFAKIQKVTVVVGPATIKYGFKANDMTFHPRKELKLEDLVKVEGVAAVDAAYATKIAAKYVTLKNMPTMNGNVTLAGNVVYDKDALEKDMKTDKELYNFFNNYSTTFSTANMIATAHIYFAVEENDVTAVNQTKTYKNKSGKLTKTHTLQLKGDVADWGTITYVKKSGTSKITVAADGTVTVKKGLKKGTYKVVVKVKAPGASDTKTLTVKIAKK